jgi:Zn-dependent metalloprotease
VTAINRALRLSILVWMGMALTAESTSAQARVNTIVASDPATIRAWDATLDAMLRSGDLKVQSTDRDTLVPGRTITRLVQLHRGVPIIGADLTRQTDATGATVSIYGTTYSNIDIDITPTLSPEEAAAIVKTHSDVTLGRERMPALRVFLAGDSFRLVYSAEAFSIKGGTAYIIDALNGAILQETNAVQRQSANWSRKGASGYHEGSHANPF